MRGLKLVLLLIAVPIVAMLASRWILGEIEGEWRAGAIEALGREVASRVPPIAEFCVTETDPEVMRGLTSTCHDITVLQWMSKVSVGALALGLALVAGIAVAGRMARNRRDLLWRLFTPGLRFTVYGLIFLIIVHAALVMTTIWYGESTLTGRVHLYVILAVGAGALTGISSMSRAAFSVVQRASSSVMGRPVSRAEHPELWRSVEEVARKLGTEPPQNIIAGLFPSFFVTESDVQHPKGVLTGRTLYLSTSLCRILTRGELEAIIGHELAHFRGEDTAFSQLFYPIYRGSEEALVALVQNTGGARSIPLLPAIYTLGFFLESFARAESELSREREFLADQAGAEAAGVRNMGSALTKVHAHINVWNQLPDRVEEALASGVPQVNASLLFAAMVQESAGPDRLEGLDAQKQPHPIDSHPPLSQRLASLQTSLAEVGAAALQVNPEQSALTLFSQGDQLEAELTQQILTLNQD